jgi:hypothetical protein
MGTGSSTNRDLSIAIGLAATSNGVGSTALGEASNSTGTQATAFGSNARALDNYSTAIGANTTAGFARSTAIGLGATTSRVNQVAIGTNADTYTLAGITSAASLAAQTGPVSLVTTDGAGNLATLNAGSLASATTVAALDGRVTNLENNVKQLNTDVRKAFEGTAVAIAMGGSALPDNKKFAISANWGTFSGENAFGGMAQMRLSENFVANAAVGAGFSRGGIGGRVGGTFAW